MIKAERVTKPHLSTAIAREFTRLNSIIHEQRKLLVVRSRCSMCFTDKLPAVQEVDKKWVHIHEDGSFLGPCFDPTLAALLALTSK